MAEIVPPRLRFVFISNYVDITALPHAPKGWQNVKLNYHRSDVYYGMVRTFSVPVSFVKDGAYLLRKAFYGDPATGRIGQASQANVQLRVEKFNTTTYLYDIVYTGDIDFSTFDDHGIEDSDVVVIEIMESGITRYTKAYEDVAYTIPINGYETINLTPIKLREDCQFIANSSYEIVEDHTPALSIVTNEQKATIVSVQDVPIIKTPPPDFSTFGGWFYRASTTTRVRMKLNLSGVIIWSNDSMEFRISIFRNDGSEYRMYTRNKPSGGGIGSEGFSITVDTGFNVVKDDTLTLFCYVDNGNNAGDGFLISQGDIKLSYETISPESQCAAIKGIDLYQQLMNKMNGVTNSTPIPVSSYLLSTTWAGLLFTSGNAIKPFEPTPIYSDGSVVKDLTYQVYTDDIVYNGHTYHPGSSFTAGDTPVFTSLNLDAYVQQTEVYPVIITSFKDFFKSVNGICNAGWGVENNIAVLENKAYFYKYSLPPIDMGRVAKFSGGKPSLSNLFSSVKYGFADQSYDQINGVTEFNSTANATFPLSRLNKILDLSIPYRGDSTGAELLRVGLNQSSSGSSTTSGNNDTWVIYCLPDGVNTWRPEPASTFGSLTGLSTNLYNLRISPKENLTRQGDYLAGVLYGLNGEYIRFSSGLKNVNLSRVGSNGAVITENADIAIGDLPQSYFIPMEATITTKEPINVLNILDRFPTGSIMFEVHSGIKLTGYIIDCNTDVPLNTPQEISVLYTINNNLLECVR